uniref:N/A n=1 Tax=Ganoderma boninense TaxID=34458 RepID=A0A5K1K2K8_9APHY|nr:N/A [Ganoderma boninense]
MASTAPPYRPPGTSGPLHANWKSLNVKPWSLARLTEYQNPLFGVGTIVALSNELIEDSRTPTKHKGQGSPNLNSSTRVLVYVWRQETEITEHTSFDGGKPFSIPHKHLIDPVSSIVGPLGGWEKGAPVGLWFRV